jgi:hypothetical protein
MKVVNWIAAFVVILVGMSVLSGIFLSGSKGEDVISVPNTSVESSASSILILHENFENPNWSSADPWDEANKEKWIRGDSNPRSEQDYWCRSMARPYDQHAAWCAKIGNNYAYNQYNHLTGLETPNWNLSGGPRYDTNMSAFMHHTLSPWPELSDPVVSFMYWSATGQSNSSALNDYMSMSWSSDNTTWNQVWKQPAACEAYWQKATVTLPLSATWISFDFFSGAAVPLGGMQEGAYVDDIAVVQYGSTDILPLAAVNGLPEESGHVVPLSISVEGTPDYVQLYYSHNSGAYRLYTDPDHPDGRIYHHELINFNSSLTGGDGRYDLYCLAVRGDYQETVPGTFDATTVVVTPTPTHALSVSGDQGLEYIFPVLGISLVAGAILMVHRRRRL